MSVVHLLVSLVGVAVGFGASRAFRRSAGVANVASVGRGVSGSLGRRKGLTPPELQRATFSEMMRHVRVGRHGAAEVPIRFAVHLHPADVATVDEAPRWFADGLADAMQRAADQHGWRVAGRIAITVEPDDGRPEGSPAVLASATDAPPSAHVVASPVAPPVVPVRPDSAPHGRSVAGRPVGPPRAFLRRADTGQRIALARSGATIGRGTDRTVVLDDPRISRRHAEISPYGSGWVVVDEGSSNGTRLNGTDLVTGRPAALVSGDELALGPFRLHFDVDAEGDGHAGSDGSSPSDHTMALDAVNRQRLSGEYLPAQSSAEAERPEPHP